MPRKNLTFREILDACGGARNIAVEVDLHTQAIYSWPKSRGIPDIYWKTIARLSGGAFEAQDVYWANINSRAERARIEQEKK